MPAPEAGERWGILGGSFDPVHLGHLRLAAGIKAQCQLNGVMLVPSYNHPFKRTPAASYDDRLAMLAVSAKSDSSLLVSDIERELNLPGHTLGTVRAIKNRYPEVIFYFVVGEDNVAELGRWHQAEELLREIPFLVGHRPPHGSVAVDPGLPSDRLTTVAIPMLDVSSTELRSALARSANRRVVTDRISPEVFEYIERNGLYR